MLKKSASAEKAKAEAKAEMKKVRSSLNLDLNLSLPHSLRPCWTAFLSILRGCSPLIPDVLTIEVPAYQNSFSAACVVRNGAFAR